MRRAVILSAVALLCCGSWITDLRAQAAKEVDLALVVAVDVSYSMDPDEQELQKAGFAEALRSTEVQDAIRRGMLGRIAVTYMEWAGSNDQRVLLPWTLLDGPEAILHFADQIAALPLRRGQRTSVSGAIDTAAQLFKGSGFEGLRKVIDVSGDGANNQGRPILPARDEAIASGITVNGLPLMLKKSGYFDVENLDLYFRDCVIGGPSAFMVPVRDKAQIKQAIKTKIILEVSGNRPPPEPLVRRVQADERVNCFAGEIRWRDRMGN